MQIKYVRELKVQCDLEKQVTQEGLLECGRQKKNKQKKTYTHTLPYKVMVR